MKKKITIEAHLLQPGMTLADRRYRIDSLLGNNGIMVTYKGYDTFRKKVVVIRELFPVDIVERDRLHDYHLDCKKLSDEALFESMKEHVIGRVKKLIRMYPGGRDRQCTDFSGRTRNCIQHRRICGRYDT